MNFLTAILGSERRAQRVRRLLVLLVHGALGGLAYTLAIGLRFEWTNHFLYGSPDEARYLVFWQNTVGLAVLVRMATIYYFRLHKGVWRYAGMNDLLLLIKAVTLGTIILIVTVLFTGERAFPRAIFINEWLLTMAFFGGLRFFRRLYSEMMYPMMRNVGTAKHKVLIVGAGSTGEMAVRAVLNDFHGQFYVVGFVDDDPAKQDLRIHDIPVLGKLSQTAEFAVDLEVSDVVFAIPNPQKKVLRDIVEACSELDIRFLIMPTFNEMMSGTLVRQEIRSVEVEDLLGRDPITLDRDPVDRYLNCKRVLISGAGGSIGSELARQVAGYGPAKLLLLEFSENALFEIHQELRDLHPDLEVVPLIGDIKQTEALEQIFAGHHPQVIYHAAAYKHVPLMEHYPVECVMNNVVGTMRLAETAIRHQAERFIMISTDKAVRPSSIMGASKRLAELVVSSRQADSPTKFSSVRFGNVLGSSGSVVPTFRKQIARGGPVTVTHSEMTRYFITIREAVELVLQAAVNGQGGEVFVLDMGEPVKIVELARNMIELSGLRENEDIKIVFTGLRPGEKLHEELVACGEEVSQTEVPKIMVHQPASREKGSRITIDREIAEMEAAALAGEQNRTVELLWTIIRQHDTGQKRQETPGQTSAG